MTRDDDDDDDYDDDDDDRDMIYLRDISVDTLIKEIPRLMII